MSQVRLTLHLLCHLLCTYSVKSQTYFALSLPLTLYLKCRTPDLRCTYFVFKTSQSRLTVCTRRVACVVCVGWVRLGWVEGAAKVGRGWNDPACLTRVSWVLDSRRRLADKPACVKYMCFRIYPKPHISSTAPHHINIHSCLSRG